MLLNGWICIDYMKAKVIWSVIHNTSFRCSVRLQLFARGPASLSAPTSVFKQPAAWAWSAGPPLMKHASCLESDNSTTCSFGAFSLLIRIQAAFLSSVRVKKGQALHLCYIYTEQIYEFVLLISALCSGIHRQLELTCPVPQLYIRRYCITLTKIWHENIVNCAKSDFPGEHTDNAIRLYKALLRVYTLIGSNPAWTNRINAELNRSQILMG